jgi:hypothetical protein
MAPGDESISFRRTRCNGSRLQRQVELWSIARSLDDGIDLVALRLDGGDQGAVTLLRTSLEVNSMIVCAAAF